MELQFEKEASDVRGKIMMLRYGDKRINLVETKKERIEVAGIRVIKYAPDYFNNLLKSFSL